MLVDVDSIMRVMAHQIPVAEDGTEWNKGFAAGLDAAMESLKVMAAAGGGLNALAEDIHDNAVEHGWWDGEVNLPEKMMMIVTEIAEAVDEYRNIRPDWYALSIIDEQGRYHDELVKETDPRNWAWGAKPEGTAVELIDCIIRCLDMLKFMGADVDLLLERKMRYNESRGYRHGNKRC